jgi:DNA-directed RNA polymerase specialized sigma24 family protein
MRRRAAGPGSARPRTWQAADDRGGRQDTAGIGAADGPGRHLLAAQDHAYDVDLGQVDAEAKTTPPRRLSGGIWSPRRAMEEELTPRQREVFEAIVINEVPADALVTRLGSNRNAIYKMMFDARHKLQAALAANGYLSPETSRRS